MHSIRILPPDIANKIAAGEVIERPASVVKELVENSIDAGAKNIVVFLEDGGTRLIRVVDDGSGIGPDDLPLAFASHATSKLSTVEDLFNIRTMGFRGEALSSIGAVSMARIISRVESQPIGAEVEVTGGQVSPSPEKGAPVGTTVEVRNLFFNVPARRKFLKAPPYELAAAHEMLTRIALAHHAISFQLLNNGEKLLWAPSVPTTVERIAALFGLDIAKALLRGEDDSGPYSAELYLSPPRQARGNARMLMFFLNRRYIRDRALFQAVMNAFSPYLDKGKYPVSLVFLKSDPQAVDVNVHPTKIEVRFREPRRAFELVHSTVQQTLAASDLSHEIASHSWSRDAAPGQARPEVPLLQRDTVRDTLERERIQERLFDFFRSFGEQKTPHTHPQAPTRAGLPQEVGPPPVRPQPAVERHLRSYFQAHDSYIVTESPDGIAIIDQHALHERILFNRIKASFREGKVERQKLLVPETVNLTFQEYTILADLRPHLAKLGFAIEDSRENTVRIAAVPSYLRDSSCSDLIHSLIDDARRLEKGGSWDEVLDRTIETLACHAAVKAGTRLSADEIEALLRKASGEDLVYACPHGRPTVVKLTLSDLEKHFRRT